MSMMNEQVTAKQSRGIKITVLAIAVFMTVVVAGFVHRIQQHVRMFKRLKQKISM